MTNWHLYCLLLPSTLKTVQLLLTHYGVCRAIMFIQPTYLSSLPSVSVCCVHADFSIETSTYIVCNFMDEPISRSWNWKLELLGTHGIPGKQFIHIIIRFHSCYTDDFLQLFSYFLQLFFSEIHSRKKKKKT